MITNDDIIEFPETPITENTFERQGWFKISETEPNEDDDMEDDDSEKDGYTFWYYMLPLPKDNPDEECLKIISNCNDEHKQIGIPKGHYYVEIEDTNGLGLCTSEEQLEILYRALTKQEIED